jgi:hypothetical protein
MSTFEFYKRSLTKIELREKLGRKYNIDMLNLPDPSIGEQILISLISEKSGIPKKVLNNKRTFRKSINFNECILPYIKFKTDIFNQLLNELRSTTIVETKNAFKKSILFKGFKYDYGTGKLNCPLIQ